MNLTAYRDGRLTPRVAVWRTRDGVVVNLWALGWSLSWTNVGVR